VQGGDRLVLALTINAAEAVKTMAEQSHELTDDSGLRLRANEGEDGRVKVMAAMADGPGAGDHVVEDHGARVFVEPESVGLLDDMVLDATVAGREIQFKLTDQG
jgi:Fe-S cluster assembly iron-binding protein IscA